MCPTSFPNPIIIGYASSANNRVIIQTSSTSLIVANSNRLYLEVRNTSTQPVWIAKGIPAVVGEGTRLNAGAIRMFQGNELYLGALNAITQGSPAMIEVEEGI